LRGKESVFGGAFFQFALNREVTSKVIGVIS